MSGLGVPKLAERIELAVERWLLAGLLLWAGWLLRLSRLRPLFRLRPRLVRTPPTRSVRGLTCKVVPPIGYRPMVRLGAAASCHTAFQLGPAPNY